MAETSDVIVVTGPPGAGKSTIGKLLGQMFELCAVVPGDEFYRFITAGGVLPWLPEAHQQNQAVTRALGTAAGCLANDGYTVVVEGVVGPWLLDEFVMSAKGSEVHYAILLPPLAECLKRVEERTHAFRDMAVTRQLHEAFDRLPTFEQHRVARPPEAPSKTASAVFSMIKSGRLLLDM